MITTEPETGADVDPAETTETDQDETTEPEADPDEAEPETFPREYVEKLRKEAADSRVKAKRADDLAGRLHVALVAATGRLADPTDLPYSEDHLTDPDALTAAVEALVTRKPHLASRRPTGSIGQGATSPTGSVDLAGLLRSRA